ncbi:MAG: PTS sugar transporter subunit IIA [Candidatus Latescibacteria bacterium]|nr:PTS sugar transporter subunit IIA [Candidatus Latescibacterota bacterium]
MNLVEYLQPESISVRKDISDKEAVLNEVVRLAHMNHNLSGVKKDKILDGLKRREELGSTGFGGGIAIPHCRLKGISDFVMGIVTVSEGVDFDSMDDEPVKLIVFVIAPEEEANAYIKLLAAISQTLRIPGVVDEIVSQHTPETVRESFLRHTHDAVETKGHENKRLFHVIVQDEDIFQQILEVFEAMPSSSVIVIEAKNTREYLVKMPLFASLWSDSHLGNSRIIVAAVENSLTNETLRSIERVTGNLENRTGVLVMVQEILYAAGSLEM